MKVVSLNPALSHSGGSTAAQLVVFLLLSI